MNQTAQIPVETILREELAHGDTALGTVAPILGHLVVSPDNTLFSDEIVAQVRGMASSVAGQMLSAQGREAGVNDLPAFVEEHCEELIGHLLTNAGFLSHCHALSIERQLAQRLHDRSAIDVVLSPLLQALIASDDPDVSSNAMAVLTAQARFIQQQGRMELPLKELPGDLFHAAVLTWRTHAGEGLDEITAAAEMRLRAEYDEGAGRLGLMSRLVAGLGNGVLAALSISHAGVAIFLTALGACSQQERDLVVQSTNDRQLGRLALGLRAGGLKPKEIEEQFVVIHPNVALPEGFDLLRRDRAAEILATSSGLAAS
ncbi:hypothetical protein QWY75_03820 [Pontixanthobacter aestiaquae]|uniref:Uncharacterized protein n=1 Tax=Pontixanthobacter aestiaquae TaxID=1509367 RepID=A0A844Z834_9SPHN|nr:hypothetical protein [Pontixanthobacter aestiaquae]MDN3645335.1 hypothetical protein [Pontixanthobacter aestiaquae]MXO83664.1 hypothetical protein [Pontixanthobacter aestiaquae]